MTNKEQSRTSNWDSREINKIQAPTLASPCICLRTRNQTWEANRNTECRPIRFRGRPPVKWRTRLFSMSSYRRAWSNSRLKIRSESSSRRLRIVAIIIRATILTMACKSWADWLRPSYNPITIRMWRMTTQNSWTTSSHQMCTRRSHRAPSRRSKSERIVSSLLDSEELMDEAVAEYWALIQTTTANKWSQKFQEMQARREIRATAMPRTR